MYALIHKFFLDTIVLRQSLKEQGADMDAWLRQFGELKGRAVESLFPNSVSAASRIWREKADRMLTDACIRIIQHGSAVEFEARWVSDQL